MGDKKNINITIISDVLCPWCWVGKRKLETAMQQTQDKYNFKLFLEPFLLKPGTPDEGTPKPEPTPEKPRVSAALKEAGAAVGINFSGIADRFPNAVPAHALIEWAQKFDKHVQLCENLYEAYFTTGEFLDVDALVRHAEALGLDGNMARSVVTDGDTLTRIAAKANHWRQKGVQGIPCYYMNGVQTFQGSREVQDFITMFDVVIQNYPQQ